MATKLSPFREAGVAKIKRHYNIAFQRGCLQFTRKDNGVLIFDAGPFFRDDGGIDVEPRYYDEDYGAEGHEAYYDEGSFLEAARRFLCDLEATRAK